MSGDSKPWMGLEESHFTAAPAFPREKQDFGGMPRHCYGKPHWREQIVVFVYCIWHPIIWGGYCSRGSELCCHYHRGLARSLSLMPNSLSSLCSLFPRQLCTPQSPTPVQTLVRIDTPNLELWPISLTAPSSLSPGRGFLFPTGPPPQMQGVPWIKQGNVDLPGSVSIWKRAPVQDHLNPSCLRYAHSLPPLLA